MNGEESLIKRIQDEDKEAMGEMFDFYYDKIFRFAYRRTSSQETAEDITSEVFLSVIKNIQNFRWKKNNSFRAWIYQIANNKICDYFRKNYRSKTIELERVGELKDSAENNPQKELISREDREEINRAIFQLSEKDQQVINLTFFEEMKAQEIAGILDCSTDSVYVRLHRALKKLKPLL